MLLKGLGSIEGACSFLVLHWNCGITIVVYDPHSIPICLSTIRHILQGNQANMIEFYDSTELKRGVLTNTLFSTHVSHFDPVAFSNMATSFLFPMAHSWHRFRTWVGTHLDILTILTRTSQVQLTICGHVGSLSYRIYYCLQSWLWSLYSIHKVDSI
jgi:hypothetical protein